MRRQRMPGSLPIWIHSKVARPSGPEKLHVISQMPGAFCTSLTRSFAGQGADGSASRRSQAGWNLGSDDGTEAGAFGLTQACPVAFEGRRHLELHAGSGIE